MLGFAARLKMDIGVIARSSRRLQGIIFLVGGQLLKTIVDLLRHEISLLDPAFDPAIGADPSKAAVEFEDLNSVTIFYRPYFAVHRGDPVPEDSLRDRHVFKFSGFPMSATTGKQQQS